MDNPLGHSDGATMAIIGTSSLTKRFKELLAVGSDDLEIQERECFGLPGPNGGS